MKRVPVKDQLADMMRAEGYDIMTAYHWATIAIAEFKASGRRRCTYYCGRSRIVLRNAKGVRA